MKKGILVVSFGTSHLDTMEKTIQAMEEDIAETFPEYKIYRAFTSRMILRKLKREEGIAIDTVEEALERMASDGIRCVAVQPTHIINGIENDRMLDEIRKKEGCFEWIRVGKPLLSSADDYKKAAHAVMSETETEPDEVLALMGHGTDHHANAAYPMLEYTFHALGYGKVLVGTAENFPDLNTVMTKLRICGARKVALMPFMMVAGDHAKNDMAGEKDSWKSEMESAGSEVRVILKGLGELKGIRRVFEEHIREALG